MLPLSRVLTCDWMACVLAFVLALLSMLSIVCASVSFSDVTRTPGQPQRSLVLQKMLRNEQVTQKGFTTQTCFVPLCDQVSNMTAGYSGASRGSVLCDVSAVVAIVTAMLQAVT